MYLKKIFTLDCAKTLEILDKYDATSPRLEHYANNLFVVIGGEVNISRIKIPVLEVYMFPSFICSMTALKSVLRSNPVVHVYAQYTNDSNEVDKTRIYFNPKIG
jgi:hypothetical protein